MEPFETTGHFWIADTPSRVVPGKLTYEPGSSPRLTLVNRVVDESAMRAETTEGGGLTITHSGNPQHIVDDNVPRVILGNTESGALTCVQSYLQHPSRNLFDFETPPLQQVWDSYTLVIGGHLPDGCQTALDGVRFVLDSSSWWSHLTDGETASHDAGTMSCVHEGEDIWLTYAPAQALDLRGADKALRSVATLVKLATHKDLDSVRLQIRVAGSAEWLTLATRYLVAQATAHPRPDMLLPASWLSLERLAQWMTSELTMNGLAAAVANPVSAALQVQALVATTLLEGVHKRLVGQAPVFRDRARELREMAVMVLPEITDPQPDWDKLVKETRIDLAHLDPQDSGEAQFLKWIIAEASSLWVLRVCLLARLDTDRATLKAAFEEDQRYGFYRANFQGWVAERAALQSNL